MNYSYLKRFGLVLLSLCALALPERSEARGARWGHPGGKGRPAAGLHYGANQRPSGCRLGALVNEGMQARGHSRGTKPQINEQMQLPFGLSRLGSSRSGLAEWMLQSIAPRTCQALTDLLASSKRGAATFDADGTLWRGDVGEGFFTWMMRNHFYPEQNMLRLETAWRGYKAGTFDGEKMYELMVTGMAGMKQDDVRRLARRYFDEEQKRQIYRPMAQLVSVLRESGFTPWVVSGSCQYVVEAGARHFGIPSGQVIGLQVRVDRDGRLTDEILRPVPWKEGKRERILSQIGHAPVIAAGNSHGDLQMLNIASDLPLVINPAADLRSQIRAGGWHVNKFTNADTLERWLRRTTTTIPLLPTRPTSTGARIALPPSSTALPLSALSTGLR